MPVRTGLPSAPLGPDIILGHIRARETSRESFAWWDGHYLRVREPIAEPVKPDADGLF